MVQMHYIYCAIYFYYYYISSTSDQQALDPQGWGLLLYTELMRGSKLLSRVLKRGLWEPHIIASQSEAQLSNLDSDSR